MSQSSPPPPPPSSFLPSLPPYFLPSLFPSPHARLPFPGSSSAPTACASSLRLSLLLYCNILHSYRTTQLDEVRLERLFCTHTALCILLFVHFCLNSSPPISCSDPPQWQQHLHHASCPLTLHQPTSTKDSQARFSRHFNMPPLPSHPLTPSCCLTPRLGFQGAKDLLLPPQQLGANKRKIKGK
jgi:hypothetical protein